MSEQRSDPPAPGGSTRDWLGKRLRRLLAATDLRSITIRVCSPQSVRSPVRSPHTWRWTADGLSTPTEDVEPHAEDKPGTKIDHRADLEEHRRLFRQSAHWEAVVDYDGQQWEWQEQ